MDPAVFLRVCFSFSFLRPCKETKTQYAYEHSGPHLFPRLEHIASVLSIRMTVFWPVFCKVFSACKFFSHQLCFCFHAWIPALYVDMLQPSCSLHSTTKTYRSYVQTCSRIREITHSHAIRTRGQPNVSRLSISLQKLFHRGSHTSCRVIEI
jgi:hypothetical protein